MSCIELCLQCKYMASIGLFLIIAIAEDDLVGLLRLVAFLNLFKALGASPITSKHHLGPVPRSAGSHNKDLRDILIHIINSNYKMSDLVI